MTDELARIILLAGFAIVMPVGIYHRVRSSTDERLDRRQEGWLILLSLRPLALAAPRAAEFYEKLGLGDRFQHVVFDGGHEFHDASAWAFVEKHL